MAGEQFPAILLVGSYMWQYLRNVFRQFKADLSSNTVELVTYYPPEDCIERLRDDIGREPIFRYIPGTHPMMGRVWKNKIWVRKRVADFASINSFQTWMTATFEQEGFKTRIRCRFGLSSVTWWVLMLWFGFIGSMCITGIVMIPVQCILFIILEKSPGTENLLVLLPYFMLAAGVAMLRVGRYVARDEQAYLTDILKTKLNARPAERCAPAFFRP